MILLAKIEQMYYNKRKNREKWSGEPVFDRFAKKKLKNLKKIKKSTCIFF